MSAWLLCVVLGLPSWVDENTTRPRPAPLPITGETAPEDLVHVRPKKKTTLQLTGPLTLELTVVGLREKRGPRLLPPGKATIRLGRAKPIAVRPSKTTTNWTVAKRPRWLPTEPVTLTLEVPAGRQRLIITPHASARLGFGLGLRVLPPADAAATPPEADLPPPSAEPPAPPPVEPAVDPSEPALPDDEPEMLGAPAIVPEPEVLAAAGFAVPTPPAQITVRGPNGDEPFYRVGIDDGLGLDSVGPGVLQFDIHALRDERQLESLKPVIIGVMVDEVLLQTLAVDRPASPVYQIVGESAAPSERVTLRMPIDAGAHRVRLTLSDTAVLGTAIRPTFVDATAVTEPGLLSAEVARAADLTPVALPEVYGSVALGLLGGVLVPAAGRSVGWLSQLDTDFAVPVAGPRFSLGLTAGFGQVEDPRRYPDSRLSAGRGRVNLRWNHLPLLAVARWSVPLPRPWGIEVGLGGGVCLAWGELRARQAVITQPLAVAPAGVGQLTLMLELGPGALVLRGSHTLAMPIDTGRVRGYDLGGSFAGLGYRFIFGQER